MEKVLPRIYANLDTDPVTRSIVLAKAFKIFNDEFGNIGAVTAKLSAKYGLANVNLFRLRLPLLSILWPTSCVALET